MSIQGLGWCIQQKTDTPTTKLVLFILSNYADEKGSCYPSENHLASIVGVSDRQIRRCLKWLIANGFIEAECRSGTSNRYYLSMDADVHPGIQHRVDADVHPSMDADVHPGRTPMSSYTKDNTKEIYTEEFEFFWVMYPRKVGKHMAAKSFKKACKDVEVGELLAATENFAELHKSTEERFIPHAQTWLNGKRFLDVQTVVNKNSMNHLAG